MITKASRSRFAGIALAAVALSTIAFGALTLLSSVEPTVGAQSLEACENERYAICISKETIGGNSEFRFDARLIEDEESHCVRNVDIEEDEFTFFLSGGESFAPGFRCGVIIAEAPQAGWQLIDIDCDFNNNIWDVSSVPNGVRIVLNPSGQDSEFPFSPIECTFVNREVRQPLNLGGLFAGQPTPLPTAPSAVAPAATAPVITPPRTGDAGLK